MTIKVGDKIPSVTLKHMDASGAKDITTDELFKGKKVLLFAVPGAFTPTCSAQHLPGYIKNAEQIKAKGVDTIACISVNDFFVMDAWGKSQKADDILMLADGLDEFTKAVGVELDPSCQRIGNAIATLCDGSRKWCSQRIGTRRRWKYRSQYCRTIISKIVTLRSYKPPKLAGVASFKFAVIPNLP